jgi:hypothetical protein
MPFVILPTNSASGGYDITNSLRFNAGSSDSLTRTPASTSGNQIFTVSFWVKRARLGVADNIFYAYQDGNNADAIGFSSSDTFQVPFYDGGAYTVFLVTTQLFRDVSAWYHIVVAIDTTQATASNRAKLYVNGTQVTAFGTETYPSQNTTVTFNKNVFHVIGAGYYGSFSDYNSLYLSEINWITGQALTPSSFGETDFDTGIWKPKAYTGSYGTNGFYLQFKNSASLGTDSSGNGNTFTVNNLTSVDQSTDTPTNNFATLNSLDNYYFTGTFTEGNLKVVSDSSSYAYCSSNFAVSQGKWYIEAKYDATSSGNYTRFGIGHKVSTSTSDNLGDETGEAIYRPDGAIKVNNTETSSWGATWTTGDIIGIALDLDNNKLYFSKNGTFQASGNPATNTNGISITAPSSLSTGVYFFGFGDNDGGGTATWLYNFGSPIYSANSYTDGAGYGNFSYAVPSGYYSLNTKNLATFG